MFATGLPLLLPRVSAIAAAICLLLLGLCGIAHGDAVAQSLSPGTRPKLPQQLSYALLAFVAGAVATRVPRHWLRIAAFPLFVGSVVLLVAAFGFTPRGGARRWIPLGPILLQPSELAKIAFVLAASCHLTDDRRLLSLRGLATTLTLAAIPMLLVLREPDLGTALLFLPTAVAMLIAAGSRFRHLASIAAVGLALLPLLWLGMSAEQKSRVTAMTSQADGGPPPRGDGYHLHQSKQSLAIGGSTGTSLDELLLRPAPAIRLPAARTDFVLCLIGQRFGLLGTAAVVACLLVLTGAAISLASRTRDAFARLLIVGLATMLVSQATVNLAMTVGLMPITGITLPLCSYGGSSLVATGIAIGLLVGRIASPVFDVAGKVYSWELGTDRV